MRGMTDQTATKKVFVDLTHLGDSNTGIGKVAENITLRLLRGCDQFYYVLLFIGKIPDSFRNYEKYDNVEMHVLPISGKGVRKLIEIPRFLHSHPVDAELYLAYPTTLFHRCSNGFSLIHDLSPWICPETISFYSFIIWRILIFKAVVFDRNKLYTVSESVKNELVELFRVDADSVDVVYNAPALPIQKDYSIIDRLGLNNQAFILSVATLHPRKNLTLLIKAFKQLQQHDSYKLVLVGKKPENMDRFIEKVGGCSSNVIITGYVTDQQLNAIYEKAGLFVSCSVYEGFGIPVIEAVTSGCPVILSDISVYREITNSYAEFFESNSVQSLTDMLNYCLKNDLRESEKFNKLKDYCRKYDWIKSKDIIADGIENTWKNTNNR